MSQLAPIDAVQTALDLLPSQFANAVKLRAYLTAIAQRFQCLDDVIQQLQAYRSMQTAQGVQLDQVGAKVGIARAGGAYPLGQSDADYRLRIYAKWLANRSQGTPEDVIGVLRALLSSVLLTPGGVKVTEAPNARFIVHLLATTPLTAAQVQDAIDFIMLAKPAGVGVSASWSVNPVFAWQGFPSPPGKGYDDGTGTVGGKWATYFLPPNP